MPAFLTNNLHEFVRLAQGKALLGLDLGEKRIGIALCDQGWMVATPLCQITRKKFQADAMQLQAIIHDRAIGGLLLGLPLMMDGHEDRRAQSTRGFATNLSRLEGWHIPIGFWDERLSTKAVENTLIRELDQTRKKRALLVDQLAASFILQGALDWFYHHQVDEEPPIR